MAAPSPGAVLADEAQAYLPDARFAAGFEKFVTRLRKGNGILWMAMQQPQVIVRHPIGQALVCSTPALGSLGGSTVGCVAASAGCSPS
jgi:type IV secretory pathway VirB4 component